MTTTKELQKRHTSSELAKMPPKQRVKAMIEQNKASISAALPSHVKPDRMLQVALTAALTTPKLLDCYTPSLLGAMVKCTQLGLEPNNALGQAYLIPFKNRSANRMDVQVIIGYKGLIALARRSGEIQSIAAYCVYEGDEFSYELGLDEHLRHVPKNRSNEITHAYAYAKYKDGGHNFEVMTRADLEKLMLSTQSKGQYGPWKDHFDPMCRKSALRKLAKILPMQIEMAEAVAIDESADTGTSQAFDRVLDGDFSVIDADEGPAAGSGAPVDSQGEIFDPAIHQVSTEDGMPIINKDGSFRHKRKAKVSEPEPEPQPNDPPPPPVGDDPEWPEME